MTQFAKLFILFGFIAVCATPSVRGQTDQIRDLEHEVGREFNRVQGYLTSAFNETDELNLSENQLTEFQALSIERNSLNEAMMKRYANARQASDRIDAMISFQTKISEMAEKLDNDILLPHQVKFLKTREFQRLVRESNGNLIELMKSGYGEDLKLTEKQQKKADAAYKELVNDAEKANIAHAKKLREINLKYRKQISDSLSLGQKAIIEKHSGKPIVPAD